MNKEKILQGIQSVEIAAVLLRVLAQERKPMTLTMLSRLAGMSPSKSRRYLVSLCRTELVHQNTDSGHYSAGPLCLALGNAANSRQHILPLALPLMQSLRDKVNETVSLNVWSQSGPMVLHYEESDHPVRLNTVVGSIMPILSSAVGQVFAAYLPTIQLKEKILEELANLISAGDKTFTDLASVDRYLAQVRKRGIARSEGNLLPTVSAICAPVIQGNGAIACAISVIGHRGVFDSKLNSPIALALSQTAKTISSRL